MKIIADENIALVEPLFSCFGEVVTVSGRDITNDLVKQADVLLVRSIIPVDQALLEGSHVKFVGTATIGTDHLDEYYLQQQGIVYASAPGCNAEGVVQYVLSALSATLDDWAGKTIGIVGCGNVGGRLYQRLQSLNVQCRCYDPFLSDQQQADLVPFAEILSCDVICLHTPLTHDGEYPTFHLFNEAVLRQLKPGTLLLNAGRGAVIDNTALGKVLNDQDLQVVLDVWEGEPQPDLSLLAKVALATPHIAGYSFDGKLRGSLMIRAAMASWCGQETAEPVVEQLAEQEECPLPASSISQAILGSYDIREDDRKMRNSLLKPGVKVGVEFDRLRKYYPKRLEFSHFVIPMCSNNGQRWSQDELAVLAALGFKRPPSD